MQALIPVPDAPLIQVTSYLKWYDVAMVLIRDKCIQVEIRQPKRTLIGHCCKSNETFSKKRKLLDVRRCGWSKEELKCQYGKWYFTWYEDKDILWKMSMTSDIEIVTDEVGYQLGQWAKEGFQRRANYPKMSDDDVSSLEAKVIFIV